LSNPTAGTALQRGGDKKRMRLFQREPDRLKAAASLFKSRMAVRLFSLSARHL